MPYANVVISTDGFVLGTHTKYGKPMEFSASLDLLWIEAANEVSPRAARAIWSLQDGYGEEGFTPCQGWDWSGIRDSSPGAIMKMLACAQVMIPAEKIAAMLGVSVEAILAVPYVRQAASLRK